MNTVSSTHVNTSANPYATDLLEALSNSQANGCLEVSHQSIVYYIFLHQGKIFYATNNIDPFERLERHLRRLSHDIPSLKNEVRTEVRLTFETENAHKDNLIDYKAINWLIEKEYLHRSEAEILITRLIQEVFESYLLLPDNTEKKFIPQIEKIPVACRLDLNFFLEECRKRLQSWQAFAPHVYSTYQRPYFFGNPTTENNKMGKVLRGFSFRQLAALFNQDELIIAQRLLPLITSKSVILREPQPPFDRLPKLSDFVRNYTANPDDITEIENYHLDGLDGTEDGEEKIGISDFSHGQSVTKQWKIACIDDSKTILNEIQRFLDNQNFSVFTIDDPLKALMQVIRVQPDIILLDVGMPNIDGYKLCGLIRKYSAFKDTPIVMVTGNKGLIDRAKAKLSGATDYMTKPFSQSDLLTMVFRYLS